MVEKWSYLVKSFIYDIMNATGREGKLHSFAKNGFMGWLVSFANVCNVCWDSLIAL